MNEEISLKRKIEENDDSDNDYKQTRKYIEPFHHNESEDENLIDINEAKKYINIFNLEFKSGFEKLSNRHDTSSLIEKKLEFDEFSNLDRAKYLVSNFGAPGSRKSSSFNYLMTNSFQYPLPNSPQAGDGFTTKPIRVRYNLSNKIHIKTFNFNDGDNDTLTKKFDEFNKEYSDFVENLMKEDIDEIIIEIPKRFLPKNRSYLENFEFLDLIGLPDQSSHNKEHEKAAIRMNRNSIDKEFVDAFFMFTGKRGKCDEEIIKYMWKCGVFTDLSDRRPPKLVACNKMRTNDWKDDNEFDKMTQAYADGTILQSIKTSLCKMFDYEDEKDYEDDFEPLLIENKFESIQDMINRSDTACIIETENCAGKINFFASNLMKIFQDIKIYKESNLYRLSIHYILVLSKELFIKLNSTVNRTKLKKTNSNKYTNIKKFFKGNQRLFKSIESDINDEISSFQNSLFDEYAMQDYYNADYDNNEDDKINYNMEWFNLRIEICQDNILLHIEEHVNDIFKHILKDLRDDDLNNFIKMRDDLDKKYLKNNFKLTTDKIIKQIKNNYKKEKNLDEILNLFMKKCFNFVENIKIEYNYEAYENENMKPKITDDLKEFQECCQKLNDIEKNVYTFLKSNKDSFECDEVLDDTFINPLLFKKARSNKLPEIEDLNDLEAFNFKKYCQKKFEPSLEDIFKNNSHKSKIALEYTEPIFLENNEIQFNLDREKKNITVSYHKNYLDAQLKLLKDNLYKDETNQSNNALYPIFISSVQRTNDFEPNLLIKDLGKVLKPNCFLIFLFIEGGTDRNRDLFKNNIDFYKNQRDNDFKVICKYENKYFTIQDNNPIVLCYLPDRNLGIGRKRKIMMMFAEHLQLLRFYFIDDDVDSFYEYDKRLHGRDIKRSPNFTYKSLAFMLKVLNFGCSEHDSCIDKETYSKKLKDKNEKVSKLYRRNWLYSLEKIKKTNKEDTEASNLVDELYDIIDNKRYNEESKIKDLINTLTNCLNAEENADDVLILNEIKNTLLMDKSKIIGQVALWNNRSPQTRSYLDKLKCDLSKKMHTHLVSYQRYQVVLYNLDAIKGIHPVTDDILFQPTFEKHEKAKLVHISKKVSSNLNDANVQKSFSYGYKCSDKAHVFYQLFNAVSGYMIYYYSFRNMNVKSKVNSDETSSEASNQI